MELLMFIFACLAAATVLFAFFKKTKDTMEWEKILEKQKSGEFDEPDDYINLS